MIDEILLIRPYASGKLEYPYGLLYLGTSLKKNGYKVEIIDLQLDPEKESLIFKKIRGKNNILIGINSLVSHYKWVKDFSSALKKENPEIKIVVGGHIAPIYETLLLKTVVDYVCLSEGEEFILDLVLTINENKSLSDVAGLAFREKGEVVRTGWRQYVKEFLLPDYDLVDMEKYLYNPNQDGFFHRSEEYKKRAKPDDKLGVIMFSRGCVGACGFCYRHMPGFRQGSIEWSWSHLMLLYKKYGIKYFRVDDELFTNNQQWFDAMYTKIKNSNINILFRITGLRVDSINEEMLKKLKEIGCIAINYGIESGSQKILDKMNKRTSVEQNLEAIRNTKKYGMCTMAYIILGYESETESTLRETAKLIVESGLESHELSLFYAQAFPGTKLYNDSVKNGLIENQEIFYESLYDLIVKEKNPIDYYNVNVSGLKKIVLKKYEMIFYAIGKSNMIFRNKKISYAIFSVLKFLPASNFSIKMITFFSKSLSIFKIFKYDKN